MLQASLKSICLVKEFFLANPFIGVFWGTLWQVSQQLPSKIPLIFGICFIILPTCCCYLVVHQLIKPHWNCVSASQIYCSSCCSLSFSLSIWPNMYRISICGFHITIFAGAVWKYSLILWGYILETAEVLHIIFPFASLVSKTKTNMHKETVRKRRKKNYQQRC